MNQARAASLKRFHDGENFAEDRIVRVAQPLEQCHLGRHGPYSLAAHTIDRGRVIGYVSRSSGIDRKKKA